MNDLEENPTRRVDSQDDSHEDQKGREKEDHSRWSPEEEGMGPKDVLPLYMQQKHIVRSYDEDLHRLTTLLTEMGAKVQTALKEALVSLASNDPSLAKHVIEGDADIDRLENKIDNFAIRLLALRQPVAQDLRHVLAAIKISAHLERVADYAEHIATRQAELKEKIHRFPTEMAMITRMGEIVIDMLDKALLAFSAHDVALAKRVWHADDTVDELHTSLMTHTMAWLKSHPEDAALSVHLLFLGKNVERMGDHITNIAEYVYYLVEGKLWKDVFPPSS